MFIKIDKEVESPGEAINFLRATALSLNAGYRQGVGWELGYEEKEVQELAKNEDDEVVGGEVKETIETEEKVNQEPNLPPQDGDIKVETELIEEKTAMGEISEKCPLDICDGSGELPMDEITPEGHVAKGTLRQPCACQEREDYE